MRAVAVTEFGGPEALHVVEVPEVHAGPGEVRVAVRAATVNPTDVGVRSGLYARLAGTPPQWPAVPGMDVAGVVDEVGPGTDGRLAVGDRVMAIVLPSGSHGAYREQVALPAASVVALPAVRDGGVVVTVRGYRGEDAEQELARGLRMVPVFVRDYAQNTAALDRLREQAEAGEVTLRVADLVPAADAAEAHRRMEAGGVRGRLVLDFG
ncbi:MAG: hypothetical protein EOP01_05905 [Propionibacteriaceae bacterium]|nr:MAG: hypothetical protein EOP01_05905 [Propionibacteriaceae bacterium]